MRWSTHAYDLRNTNENGMHKKAWDLLAGTYDFPSEEIVLDDLPRSPSGRAAFGNHARSVDQRPVANVPNFSEREGKCLPVGTSPSGDVSPRRKAL